MRPAFNTHSRTLFTAATAVVLGLQVAPWPTHLQAQENTPGQLLVQSQAKPITPPAQTGQQQFNNIQRPAQPAQQPQQKSGPPQYPKSEVRRELEKLYEQDGRAVPEMVDPQFSQPAEGQSGAMPPATSPQSQASPQNYSATPVSAPKKKGFFSKLFGSKNDGPTQPPAEQPYIPPTASLPMTPPAALPSGQAATLKPGTPNYSQLFQPGQTAVGAAPQLQAPPQQFAQQPVEQPPVLQAPVLSPPPAAVLAPATDGFEAPLYVESPATNPGEGLPAIDFSAPLAEPDTVDLGQPAPLTVTEKPAEPADPFSDDSLFPGAKTAAPAARGVEPDDVAAVEAAPAVEIPTALEAAPVEENPYSGLTLDEDAYSNPSTLKVAKPAPLELPSEELSIPAETVETSPPALMVPPNPDASADEPPLVLDELEATPPATLTPAPRSGNERTRVKQEMIAARKGLRGLKGFCPVVLREDRDLIDAHSEYRVIFNSKTYYLSSSEAVAAFHSDPAKYAPAARGCDVIQQAVTGEEVEGSLDFAVWYKGRLYMFTSAETMDTFVSAPSSHATLD